MVIKGRNSRLLNNPLEKWVSFFFCSVLASQDGELVDLTIFQCDVIPALVVSYNVSDFKSRVIIT